jgi:hypothetical protein
MDTLDKIIMVLFSSIMAAGLLGLFFIGGILQ